MSEYRKTDKSLAIDHPPYVVIEPTGSQGMRPVHAKDCPICDNGDKEGISCLGGSGDHACSGYMGDAYVHDVGIVVFCGEKDRAGFTDGRADAWYKNQ